MRRVLSAFLLLLTLNHFSAADTVGTTVTVVDSDGRPIEGARVTLGERVMYTSALGAASFPETGPAEVEVLAPGFEPAKQDLSPGKTASLVVDVAQALLDQRVRLMS